MSGVPQPSGTVTLVFTDIEGSTRLLDELGVDAYREALAGHRRVVRGAFARHDGYEVDSEGDAFFYAFATATAAIAAVADAMAGLAEGPVRIRVGVHTGQPALDPPKYVGLDVHRAARVMAAAQGGQVVVSAETVALLDGSAGLVPLGSFRLKDFDEPVVLYQLGVGRFPPLRTLANTNLPTAVSSFVGREGELAEADGLLRETRLLTVTGPGGAGKTRFAVELAHRVREERFGDYPDGVFACFLSALRDPELVLPTIVQSLSLREQAGLDALETLSGQLQAKRLLLVLDNLEQLLPVAPRLSELLRACPRLTLLCTSRETLRLQGETVYALPALTDNEAVTLFCDRARVVPTEPIRQLCGRLEGLPLALELAAARLTVLTPLQLADRLSERLDLLKAGRDVDPRQQTLRATIEWSHELLTSDERQLFARLSVFAGGCTLDAAEAVCEADLDTLQSLAEKSLLRFSEERYWMLETIREYAVEQLDPDDVADLRRRHADYFLEYARRAEPELERVDQLKWLKELGAETENFRRTLDTLACAQEADSLLRLCAALGNYWLARVPLAEASAWFSRALAMDGADPVARAGALQWAPWFPLFQGDLALSRRLAEEAIEACGAVGDVRGVGRAMNALSGSTPDLASRRVLLEDSLPLFRQAQDEWGLSRAMLNLGYQLIEDGDRAEARRYLEQARGIARERGDRDTVAGAEYHLGLIAALYGDDETGGELVVRSARASAETGDFLNLAHCLIVLAHIARRSGDGHRAAALLGSVAEASDRNGFPLQGTEMDLYEAAVEQSRSMLGDQSFDDAFGAGRGIRLEVALDELATPSTRIAVDEGVRE